MKWVYTVGLVAVAAVFGAADDKGKTFTFGKADAGKVPAGWKAAQTGKGTGVWKVVEDKSAPSKSGYALAQSTADRDAGFNLCVAEDTRARDLEVSVAFKANKGEKDQGGGVVW